MIKQLVTFGWTLHFTLLETMRFLMSNDGSDRAEAWNSA